MTIYVFPAAAVFTAVEWGTRQTVASSRSLRTGFRRVSVQGERRRFVRLSVSGRNTPSAAGLMEEVKRTIEGGRHFLRVSFMPWTDITVRGGSLTGDRTTRNGLPALSISGGAVSATIARAHEFATWNSQTVMLIEDAVTNGAGETTVMVDPGLSGAGSLPVTLGVADTAVFEATQMPSVARVLDADFYFDWTLREVLAAEHAGHSEVTLWP